MLRSLPLENTVITTWEVLCTSCERSEPTTGSTSCHSNEMLKYGGAFYDLVEDVCFMFFRMRMTRIRYTLAHMAEIEVERHKRHKTRRQVGLEVKCSLLTLVSVSVTVVTILL